MPTSSFIHDLFKRRVPQIVGIYLAAGWGVLEFVNWLVERYNVSAYLIDLSLVIWASMIPTVLLLAYFHGAKGGQGWTRLEKIGIPANLVVAAILIAMMMSGRDLSAGSTAGARLGIAAASTDRGFEPTRIAVLYFDDDSEAQTLGHLANAFTGALIDELTQVKALDVIPRSGVKLYRGMAIALDSIADALRIGTLVEGSVSGTRDRLVLSVTLIDPATQTSLESFTLDGDIEDWLELRSDMAKRVAHLLRRRLGVEIRLRERRAGTRSADALELLADAEQQRAEAQLLQAAGESEAAERELRRTDATLAEAGSLDPNWVEPVVLRGWVALERATLTSFMKDDFDREAAEEALAHAERALVLKPGDPAALELRGSVLFKFSRDSEANDADALRSAAEQDLLAAVRADPLRAHAWNTLSSLHQLDTRFVEAKRDAERALEADPFLREADVVLWRLYESSQELMEMEEAARWCEEGHRRFPEKDYFVSCSLFVLTLSEGPEPDVERAWALADTNLYLAVPEQREQLRLFTDIWVGAVLARAGLTDSATAVVERVRAAAGGDPWIDYYAASVRLLQGERDEALKLLSGFLEAIPQRKEYIASDWTFRELWDDPRFQALVGS